MMPPRLRATDRARLATILAAAHNGDLGIVRSLDSKTGEPVTLLVARSAEPDGCVALTPLAAFNDDNPYERYTDPTDERRAT